MEDLQDKQSKYNDEPVEYCVHCLSLAIRDINGQPYCDKCGCTAISKIGIHAWEEKYEVMYGKKYIIKK